MPIPRRSGWDTQGDHEDAWKQMVQDGRIYSAKPWGLPDLPQRMLQRSSSTAAPVASTQISHLRNGISQGDRQEKHSYPIPNCRPYDTHQPKYHSLTSASNMAGPLDSKPLFSALFL